MLIREIAITQISPDPDQPRKAMDTNEIKNLAASMEAVGQMQPAVVYEAGDGYLLVDGHRRFAAAESLQWTAIHAIVLEKKPDSHEITRLQLTANCLRVGLTPVELGRSIEQLKEELGYNNTEIARYLSLSKSKVTQALAVLTLPKAALQKLDDGTLAASTAYAIARTTDPEKREELLSAAMAGRLKRSEAVRDRCSPPKRQLGERYLFQLTDADISIAAAAPLELDELIEQTKELLKQLRSAARKQLTGRILEQILAAQQSRKADAESGCSGSKQVTA